jgi:hypothetical protein
MWSAERTQLQEEKRNRKAAIDVMEMRCGPQVDAGAEVVSAMNVVKQLVDLAADPSNLAAVGEFFQKLNARLFLQFKEEAWGKRKVRKPAGGVVTFGAAAPPIRIYQGPTGRRQLSQAAIAKSSGAVHAAPEALKSNCPGREGDSLGNVNRSDGTPIELFLRFCGEIVGLGLSLLNLPNQPEREPKRSCLRTHDRNDGP